MAIKDNQREATLCAYLAGLFDGEGTIRINKIKNPKNHKNPKYDACISIGMTDRNIIKLICKIFGLKMRTECVHSNRKIMYRCGTSGRLRVPSMLKKIIPFLRVKKKQAELVIKFCELGKIRRIKKTKCVKCKNVKSEIRGYGLCGKCYMSERRGATLEKWKKYKQIKTLSMNELQRREDFYLRVKKLNAVGAPATTKQEDTREGKAIV